MEALKKYIGYAFAFLFMASIVVSCNSGDTLNDKPYTPLYVYFNPLKLDMRMETLMPYFVNYPTDWAKMGLRSHPMTLSYEYNNAAWGVTATSQYVFLANGRLSEQRRTSFNVGASGFDVLAFEYDNNSNLIKIVSINNGNYKHQNSDDGFTYDTTGRLTRRDKNGRDHYNTSTYFYEYHENGALKSFFPEREDENIYESGVTIEKMQFDSLAHMKRFETPKTTNEFLQDISNYNKGKSVITYTYTDNLCTQAVEKIPVKFDRGTETLTCTSTFTYNSHGDLATWTYSGGVYKSKGNSWLVDDMTFTITYDYVYDEKGNWTQAKITFPTNIDEIPALRTYYKASKNGFTSSQDHSSAVIAGETPFLTIERTIDYWNDDVIASIGRAETSKAEIGKAQKDNGLRYKGTDTFGLLGKVKSVTEEHERLEFDQSGNLIYEKNSFGGEITYKYITPTTYDANGLKKGTVNIKIKEGLRSDTDSDPITELNQKYMFDEQQRLTKHIFSSHMAIVTNIYQYKENNKYPSTMVEEHPEDGITTYHYTYTQFDEKSNWTEREVSSVTEYDDYDDDMNYIGKKQTSPTVYMEKRVIEYW